MYQAYLQLTARLHWQDMLCCRLLNSNVSKRIAQNRIEKNRIEKNNVNRIKEGFPIPPYRNK